MGKSVHGKIRCVDCHTGIKDIPHPKGQPIQPPTCVKCHKGAVEKHGLGIHGAARAGGNLQTATCTDCHGTHGILSAKDPESATHHSKVPATCGKCHGGLRMAVEVIGAPPRAPFFAYQESVHGRALANGKTRAAVCNDCHRSHDILPTSDPNSSIFRFNVPDTCGHCHGDVKAQYVESIHGTSSRRGANRAPVCTDCHGIHTIKNHLDQDSSVSSRAIARTTCPQCHQSMAMAQEFGIPSQKVKTYLESYHGLAGSRGSTVVANCASCHGIHNIYPSNDARSTVHPDRLVETCGKCHPGVGENFVRGKIHELPENLPAMGTYLITLVRNAYIGLIFGLIALMCLHNFLDLRKKSDPANRVLPEEFLHSERMNLNQRIQHAILASSFILLVLSGFALSFPDSWLSILFGPGEDARRLVHRAAAVAMVVLSIYHLLYMAAARSGRRAFLDLMPGLSDLHEASHLITYNLGLRGDRPHPVRFGYPEKMEYWALVWGTIVMAATGMVIWFKTFATQTLGLPLWILDLARVIHYYEALLAALAILVWHMYAVIFDPVVYPMNWTWLVGRIRKKK